MYAFLHARPHPFHQPHHTQIFSYPSKTKQHSYKEVVLTADLIDRARPGEDIEVTGVYKYRADMGGFNARNGFPVFSTCIEVRGYYVWVWGGCGW